MPNQVCSYRAMQVGMILAAVGLLAGCAEKKVHAIPWATAVQVRPVPPVPRVKDSQNEPDIAPDFRVEQPSGPARIFGVRPGPARPRVIPAQPAENMQMSKTPMLVPEMSAKETATAQQQANDSLAIVEKNLGIAHGHSLNAAQADLVSKVNGFVTESREAGREGDWARARNLAKKAQLLSEELVGAF
jgi:hypothetical protein